MTNNIKIIALALLLAPTAANAETPNERCVTKSEVNVTTLPMATDKMWHQTSDPKLDRILHSAIWFKLSKGVHIDLYNTYIDKAGVEWAWGSALVPENNDAIVSGWVKHSSLKCGVIPQ